MLPTACLSTPSTVLSVVVASRLLGVEADLNDQWNADCQRDPVRLYLGSLQALNAAGATAAADDASAGPSVDSSGASRVTVTWPDRSVVTRTSVELPSGCVS